VVPTSFVGVDSLDKTRFRFFAGRPSLLLQETESERGDVSPFHLIAPHLTEIVVMSTVVPTSFVDVDSFDKMRFRFFAVRPSLLLRETESGGGVLSQH
jgi:hypothetical protein